MQTIEAGATSPQANFTNLNELDQLLAESKPPRDELADLLSESMAIKEEEAHIKYLRERTKRGGLTAEQAREDEARIREWEAKREWKITANVGVFELHECSCGNTTSTWAGLMHAREHRTMKVTGYVRASAQIASLPNLVAAQIVKVDCCPACASKHGWDLDKEVDIVWEEGV